MNSFPKTVTRQRRGCDLNPGPSAPESNTLTDGYRATLLRLCDSLWIIRSELVSLLLVCAACWSTCVGVDRPCLLRPSVGRSGPRLPRRRTQGCSVPRARPAGGWHRGSDAGLHRRQCDQQPDDVVAELRWRGEVGGRAAGCGREVRVAAAGARPSAAERQLRELTARSRPQHAAAAHCTPVVQLAAALARHSAQVLGPGVAFRRPLQPARHADACIPGRVNARRACRHCDGKYCLPAGSPDKGRRIQAETEHVGGGVDRARSRG